MIKKIKNNQQKGFTLLIGLIIILSISLIIGLGLSSLIFSSLISLQNKTRSTQSYYAAEAGLEDSLLRLKRGMQASSLNTLTVGESLVTIDISDLIGGSRTITAEGNTDNRIRKLSVTYILTTDEIAFYYGAQVDEGGILMGNNARIEGNVFSNGSILPSTGGSGQVTDTAAVAINGNKIDSANIGGDAYVHTCKDSNITGTLYYVSGGSIQNCTFGALINMGPNQIDPKPLPISSEQITEWKDEIAVGGTIVGDYTLINGATDSLGPVKITGNLLIDNNSTLTLTGAIYVVGNVTIQNNSTARLSDSFGSLSGLIITDGKIIIRNNAILEGSGQEGSFIMLLSTNNSLDPVDPAIDVVNNAEGAIFYASNGVIHLHNNIVIREATGYQLSLDNNAIIRYLIGLESVNFTTGPGGSWKIIDWQEIE